MWKIKFFIKYPTKFYFLVFFIEPIFCYYWISKSIPWEKKFSMSDEASLAYTSQCHLFNNFILIWWSFITWLWVLMNSWFLTINMYNFFNYQTNWKHADLGFRKIYEFWRKSEILFIYSMYNILHCTMTNIWPKIYFIYKKFEAYILK